MTILSKTIRFTLVRRDAEIGEGSTSPELGAAGRDVIGLAASEPRPQQARTYRQQRHTGLLSSGAGCGARASRRALCGSLPCRCAQCRGAGLDIGAILLFVALHPALYLPLNAWRVGRRYWRRARKGIVPGPQRDQGTAAAWAAQCERRSRSPYPKADWFRIYHRTPSAYGAY